MTPERESALLAELGELNAAVDAAIARRTAWLDAHTAEAARVPVGGKLYNLDTGQCLGTVTRHYRYWRDRDQRFDVELVVHYEYLTGRGFKDNTSRQRGLRVGTGEQARRELERKLNGTGS